MEKIFESVTRSPYLEKYGLRFVGIGSENACFEVEGSEKKLIKVNIRVLKTKVLQMLNDPRIKDIPVSNLEQKKNIEEYNFQEKNIKEIFGDKHVLDRGGFRKKIPLNRSLIITILGKDADKFNDQLKDDEKYEIEMFIHTQLIAPELKKKRLYQTEDYSIDLIRSDDFENSKNIDEALKKIENLIQKEFLVEKLAGSKYTSIIKEITEKIIQYTKKTGLMIDIFGPDNITMFTKENGEIDFHLLDVILPGALSHWGKNIKDDKGLELLRHAYTFYYSIRNLAEKIGIKENLELQDMFYFKGANIPTGEWLSKKLN